MQEKTINFRSTVLVSNVTANHSKANCCDRIAYTGDIYCSGDNQTTCRVPGVLSRPAVTVLPAVTSSCWGMEFP